METQFNKANLYLTALNLHGFDRQLVSLAEQSSALSVAACQMLNHKGTGKELATECADVEIMIEQMRYNGMEQAIDSEKQRKLARLALLLTGCDDIDAPTPAATLKKQAAEIEYFACNDFEAMQTAILGGDWALAGQFARRAAGRLMHLAQSMGRLASQTATDKTEAAK